MSLSRPLGTFRHFLRASRLGLPPLRADSQLFGAGIVQGQVKLHETLIVCKTWRDHYGWLEKVRAGIVGGMPDINAAKWLADKVITF